MMSPGIMNAWAAELGAGLGGALTFIALYASLPATRSQWYRSSAGLWLMAVTGVLAGLLGLSLTVFVWRIHWLVWLGAMLALDIVIWSLVIMVWQKARRKLIGRQDGHEDMADQGRR